jgi:hypothetical protein
MSGLHTSSNRIDHDPEYENAGIDFRVASVPEQSSLILISSVGLILRKREN